jgi:hypothetical protein
MTQTCSGLEQLRRDHESCDSDKNQQIDGLAKQFSAMRGDMLRIEGDLNSLAKAVTNISRALDIIASNTTAITEVVKVYQNIKGFGFVVKNVSVILVGFAAFVAAAIFLLGVKVNIGA